MPSFIDSQIVQLAREQHVDIFLWNINETTQELLSMLPEKFNYEQECARRFGSAKRCREWLATRVLLHRDAAIADKIQYKENGKPYLGGQKHFIGISHSSNCVCLALAEFPFGIDVEQRGGKARRLYDKFLKEKEWILLQQINLSEEDASTLAWSAKEAVYKMVDSFSPSLYEEININEFNTDKCTLEISVLNNKDRNYSMSYIVRYVVLHSFVLTLAIKKQDDTYDKPQKN